MQGNSERFPIVIKLFTVVYATIIKTKANVFTTHNIMRILNHSGEFLRENLAGPH